MPQLRRARWGSAFEPEPFLSAILRTMTLLSAACIVVALGWRRVVTGGAGTTDALEGTNVLSFVLADVRQALSGVWGPHLLLHTGIAALFLIPYARTLASLWYFTWVERNIRCAAFSGCVCTALTYILFLG